MRAAPGTCGGRGRGHAARRYGVPLRPPVPPPAARFARSWGRRRTGPTLPDGRLPAAHNENRQPDASRLRDDRTPYGGLAAYGDPPPRVRAQAPTAGRPRPV
nr:hypothetical protein [Streptomyces europaeiscabiei]